MGDANQPPRTLVQVLEQATRRLAQAGVPEARHNAELLLAALIGTDRGGLYVRRETRPDASTCARLDAWVARRQGREPLQQIVGTQEFYGLEFDVTPDVLVPRPETEGLIDAVLALDPPRGARVADLGTGSGCIAITLAVRRPDLRVYGLDVSESALVVAARNAARHGLGRDRVAWVRGDLACPPEPWAATLDVVVSNPPYVPEADWEHLQVEVRDFEPRVALVPGPTGLEAYEALVPAARGLLRPEGVAVVEIGFSLHERVQERFARGGFSSVEVRPDLNGIPRVLIARGSKPGPDGSDGARA